MRRLVLLDGRCVSFQAAVTSPPHTQSASYRADIDGLRAVAVLAVVLYHAFPARLPGGFVGVDVFFVISGYLITRIVQGRLEQGRFSFADFYIRRVRRIFPALCVVLAATLVAGWVLLLPGELQALGGHALAAAGFVANIAFWADIGYFDPAAETKPLLHLWSLGIEEQFYLLWPLLLWWAWRGRRPLWVVAAVVAGLSFLVNLLTVSGWPDLAFYFPHTRVWELATGALLALRAKGTRYSLQGNTASWLGMGLLLLGFVLIRSAHTFPGAWALLPVLGTVLLIEAGERAWLNRRVLAHPAMVYCGLISFPLYLWHWPALSFLYVLAEGAMPSAFERIAAVMLSVGLAVLTWRLIEQPLRYGGSAKGRTRLLLIAMVMVAAASAALWASRGAPARFEGSMLMDEEKIRNERLAYWAQGEWRRNYDTGTPKIITFGDSQGFDIFKSLGLDTSLGIQHFESSYECTAFDQPARGKDSAAVCTETFQRLFDSGDLESADVFIYAHSWWRENEPDNAIKYYREALARLLEVNPDLRVVFIGPKPFLGHHWVSINTLIKDQKSLSGLNKHLNQINWVRTEDINHARQLAQELDVLFIDAASVFCLDGCHFVVDGEFAYFDQNHWTGVGARVFHENLRRSGEWGRIFGGLPQHP